TSSRPPPTPTARRSSRRRARATSRWASRWAASSTSDRRPGGLGGGSAPSGAREPPIVDGWSGRHRLLLRLPRRERGGQRHGDGPHEDAPVEEHVDGAARRGAVGARAGADGEDPLGERRRRRRRRSILIPSPILAHRDTSIDWPKARSAASQKARQAGYSAGVMRAFLKARLVRTITLPEASSKETEKRPKGVSSWAGVGGRVTCVPGGRRIVHSSSLEVRACSSMSRVRLESEAYSRTSWWVGPAGTLRTST